VGCINRVGAEYSGAAAVSAFSTAKNPLQLPGAVESREHIRANTYAHTEPFYLYREIPGRRRQDSIKPPTCTKEDLPIILPRFVGCRPPATGCTHIRIQSSRIQHRELCSLLLFLYFSFLPRPLANPFSIPPLARDRQDSLFSFLSFFLAIQAECVLRIFMFQRRLSGIRYFVLRPR